MERVGKVVVVGGGVAGVSCVSALRAGGYDGELVLIDRAEFPYDRPPLSKAYLAGTSDLKAIALQQPEWYEENSVQLIGHADVVAVRPAAGEVELASGDVIAADRIVLATGGTAIVPPIPGAAGSSRVHVLRDHSDADALRAQLEEGSRLLVVGAGLIGAEVASTAREHDVQVTLVDPLDPPIAAAVGPDLARWLHDDHARHGVETIATTLESLQDTGSAIQAQLTGEATSREFDAVLIGVGIRPATALAEAAGLEVDRGILVDERQVTSAPNVLAVGDNARLRDHARTEHWEAAQWDGQRAAATILGTEPPTYGTHWFWSDRYHRHVEGVGDLSGADSEHLGEHTVVTRGEMGEDPFSVWVFRDGKVIGAATVDDPNAVRAARRLIDRGTAVDPAVIADPSTNLRSLLRG